MLRLITDGRISPEEAVRAYHGILRAKKIAPRLPLEKDLELTDQSMSYDGTANRRATVSVRENPLASKPPTSTAAVTDTSPAAPVANGEWPKQANGSPDFERMNSAHRSTYDKWRLTRKFG